MVLTRVGGGMTQGGYVGALSQSFERLLRSRSKHETTAKVHSAMADVWEERTIDAVWWVPGTGVRVSTSCAGGRWQRGWEESSCWRTMGSRCTAGRGRRLAR